MAYADLGSFTKKQHQDSTSTVYFVPNNYLRPLHSTVPLAVKQTIEDVVNGFDAWFAYLWAVL